MESGVFPSLRSWFYDEMTDVDVAHCSAVLCQSLPPNAPLLSWLWERR